MKVGAGASNIPSGHSLWPNETFPNDPFESNQTSDEIKDSRRRLAAKFNKTINGRQENKLIDEQRVTNESANRVKRRNQRGVGKTSSKNPLDSSTSKETGHIFASSASSIKNASRESEVYRKHPTLSTNLSRQVSKKTVLQEHGRTEGIFGRMSEIHSPPLDSPAQQLPWKKTSSALDLLPEGVRRRSSTSFQNLPNSPSILLDLSSRMSNRGVEHVSPLEVIDHLSVLSPGKKDKIMEILLKEVSNIDPHVSTSSSNIASEVRSNPLQNALDDPSQSVQSSPNSDLLFLDSSDILPMSATLSGLYETGGIRNENPSLQDANPFLSPQVLGDMLLRLQVPSVGELANVVPVTRITPELVDAITNFIDNISDAVSELLTDLQEIFNENPLLASLLAIGLFALLWHLLAKGKKKKGHGYGHHEQGYHRSWQPQFRKLDDHGQRLTLKVLSDLEGFRERLNIKGNINQGL